VEKEVDDMLEGWRGVEESGKSLKDACERLLEERVGRKEPSSTYCPDYQCSGRFGRTHR